jgi:hypothetical protein
MAGAHVTLVRLPFEYATPAVPANYTACLDAFAANGIGVLWSINPPTGGEKPPATGVTSVDYQVDMATWVPPYEQWIKNAVDTFGRHPATYIWAINNEADGSVDGTCSTKDLWLGNKASGQPALAEALFAYTKSLDTNHVVTTSVAGCVDQDLDTRNVPSLDLWAVNSYGPIHASGTGAYWTNLKKDPRPVVFTEFGTDRYTCWGGLAHGVSCSTAAGSGENQTNQRNWEALTWDNIAANLASPTNPQGAVIGGTKFMYSDLWWYSLPFTTGGPATHDVGGDWVNNWGDDGVQNFKWWGVSAALPAGSTQLRYTSLAFDALGDRWGTAGPAITSVNITFARMANNNCLADVTWTTSEAATTQLLGGLNLEAGNQGGDMVVDNTLFGVYSEDGTFTTAHHAQALDLLNGSHYKFAVRSFTSDGRHHTIEPMIRNHIAC